MRNGVTKTRVSHSQSEFSKRNLLSSDQALPSLTTFNCLQIQFTHSRWHEQVSNDYQTDKQAVFMKKTIIEHRKQKKTADNIWRPSGTRYRFSIADKIFINHTPTGKLSKKLTTQTLRRQTEATLSTAVCITPEKKKKMMHIKKWQHPTPSDCKLGILLRIIYNQIKCYNVI